MLNMVNKKAYKKCNEFAKGLQQIFDYKAISAFPSEEDTYITIMISHSFPFSAHNKHKSVINKFLQFCYKANLDVRAVQLYNEYRLKIKVEDTDKVLGLFKIYMGVEK